MWSRTMRRRMALLAGVLLSLSSIAWIGIQPSPYRYATQAGSQGGTQGGKPAAIGGAGWLLMDEVYPESGWSGWDNTSIHICVAQNPSDGGDEAGVGVQTGGNLTWHQSGNIAGMTGPGSGWRQFDALDDYFYTEPALANSIMSFDPAVFCIIHKIKYYSDITNSDVGILNYTVDGSGNNRVRVTTNVGCIKGDFADDGSDTYPETADQIPDSGDVYIYIESDGTNCKVGWHTSRVGSWSEIPSSQQDSHAKTLTWAGLSFDTTYCILGDSAAAHLPSLYWYYTIFAKKTLEQLSS